MGDIPNLTCSSELMNHMLQKRCCITWIYIKKRFTHSIILTVNCFFIACLLPLTYREKTQNAWKGFQTISCSRHGIISHAFTFSLVREEDSFEVNWFRTSTLLSETIDVMWCYIIVKCFGVCALFLNGYL